MKSPTHRLLPLLATALLTAAGSISSTAAVLYSANFVGTGNGSISGASPAGWTAFGSLEDLGSGSINATEYTNTAPGTSDNNASNRLGRTNGAGNASDRALFIRTGNTASTRNDRFVVATTFAPLSLGSDPETSLGSVTWNMGFLVASAMHAQVLVQVDGNWYVSLGTFSTTNNASSGNPSNKDGWESKSLDFNDPSTGLSSTAWSTISFDATGGIVIGTQVDDPLGTEITGIGLYVFAGNASGRVAWIDDIQIHSVPEPSTLMLSGLLFSGLLGLRKRKA